MKITGGIPNTNVEPEPPVEAWWTAVMGDETAVAAELSREGRSADRAPVERPSREENELERTDWEMASRAYEAEETLELRVIGHNRGGLLVALSNLRGFVPASHLVNFPVQSGGEERIDFLARRLDDRLLLKIIEFDPARGRIVLSERAALAGPGRRRQVLNGLERGSLVKGTVTNLTHFGAFVDLGGVEGLIHVSEVSWGHVEHPRCVLNLGQEVTAYVLSVDCELARVALSLRRLQPDPWTEVEKRYAIGQVVQGTVTNVVEFGAFVRIEDGLEGLIHVSELAEGNFMHPRNVVREGQVVDASIISLSASQRRLGLSLRRVRVEELAAN